MLGKIEERRLITILFADLAGFTTLSQKLDPEDVREVANTCFEYLNQVIINNGGTVHKYEGDLVIALFGLPIIHEDDPERAIRASFVMMDTMPQINKVVAAYLRKEVDLGLHIGINSGVVVVGEVGSHYKKEDTVMGEAVNLASRLKDAAERGKILVSESVFRASRYLFDYSALPPLKLKGIDEEVRVYTPRGIKAVPEPKRGISGLHSVLVGRDSELNTMKKIYAEFTSGKGKATFVSGDAGMGKTRLYEEFKAWIASQKTQVMFLEGKCFAADETTLYGPYTQVLKKLLKIGDHDDQETIKERIVMRTREIFPDEWQEVAPHFGYLFSTHFAADLEEKIKYLNPRVLKSYIFASMKKFFSKLAKDKFLMLVIEDFHWIDSASLEFTEFLLDGIVSMPMLFLGLTRIEKDKSPARMVVRMKEKLKDNFCMIQLKPLDQGSSTTLMQNLLAFPGFPAAFKEKVLAKAGGIPFFLEEIIHALIDEQVLFIESGKWVLRSDPGAIRIPDNVHAVIASRLDRLEPETKESLQIASVIGRTFYLRLLENLCGIDPLMLSLHLAALEEYEYIVRDEKQAEIKYSFRHPIIQDVAYNSLLKKRKRELHQRTAETIENLYADRLDEFSELLAYQYMNSDNSQKAITWLKKAGLKAKLHYANSDAIQYFEKLAKLLKEVKPDAKRELCACFGNLGDIYHLTADLKKALEYYEAMHNYSMADPMIESQICRFIADVYYEQGRFDEALDVLSEAEKMMTEPMNDAKVIELEEVHLARSRLYFIKGELDKAVTESENALRTIETIRIAEEKAKRLMRSVFIILGFVNFEKAEYGKAIRLYQKCLIISEDLKDKRGQEGALNNLAVVYYHIEDFDKAAELMQKAMDVSVEIGDKRSYAAALGNLGVTRFNKGEYAQAIELYEKYLQIAEEIGYKHGVGVACGNLGEVYLKTGELERAEEFTARAEKIWQDAGNKSELVKIYCQSAELTVKKGGKTKTAIAEVNKAMQIAEDLGLKPAIANCHFVSGIVHTRAGDFANADESFSKASEVYSGLKQRKFLAETYLEHAKMHKQKGAKKKAGEYYEKAVTLFKELKLENSIKAAKAAFR